MNYPDIWGADALFTYGGSGSVTGRLCSDKLAIRFETPIGCTVEIAEKEIKKTEYECIMPDLICGKLFCTDKEICFDIMAVSPQSFVVRADSQINIRTVFSVPTQVIEQESITVHTAGEETVSYGYGKESDCIFALSMGNNADQKVSDILTSDISAFKKNLKDKYALADMPKNITGRYEALYRRCLALVQSNIRPEEDFEIFAKRTAHGLVTSPAQAMLISVGLKKLFPKQARETILKLTSYIDEKGLLPSLITSGAYSDGTCAAPLLPWAFYEIIGDDRDTIQLHYEALRRHIMYYVNERDMNKNNLYHWLAGGKNLPGRDSGMENSPRFDENVITDAPDLGAYLYMSVAAMRKMSELINKNNDILFWGVLAERIRLGTNDFLFDEKDIFYYDRGVIGKKLNKVKTTAGFMPLFGGICPPIRLTKMMSHLNDATSFGAKYGVPSVAKSEKEFSSDMHRGAVYFEDNFKIVYGLLNAGKTDKAAELVSRCLEAACRAYETDGVIYEYYHCSDTAGNRTQTRNGYGGGSMGVYGYDTCHRDCSASAAFLLAMIHLITQ